MITEQINRIDEMINRNRGVMEKLKEQNICLTCAIGTIPQPAQRVQVHKFILARSLAP